MAGNLVANTDTVTHQVKQGKDLRERKKQGHSLKQELNTLRKPTDAKKMKTKILIYGLAN